MVVDKKRNWIEIIHLILTFVILVGGGYSFWFYEKAIKQLEVQIKSYEKRTREVELDAITHIEPYMSVDINAEIAAKRNGKIIFLIKSAFEIENLGVRPFEVVGTCM